MEEEKPNKSLEKVCEALFYKGGEEFKGKIGVKVVGSIMGAPEKEFEGYLKDLENLTKNDRDYEKDVER